MPKKAAKKPAVPPGEGDAAAPAPEKGTKQTTLDVTAAGPKAKPRKRVKPAAATPTLSDDAPPAPTAEPAASEAVVPAAKPKKKAAKPAAAEADAADPSVDSESEDAEEGRGEVEKPDEVDGDPEAEAKVKEEYVVDEAVSRSTEADAAREQIKKIIPKKFWMVDPWRTLLDPGLAKEAEILNYDLSKLIRDFFDLMLKEEIIDFRISGIATYSAARMHHWKILETIKEEEKAEEQRQRERLERTIPKAIAQPLREARKIATTDDLIGAMRRAIIETMQKREKLRLRRVVREQKRAVVKQLRIKGQLPKEILKQIIGKGETVEEMLARWLEKIKASASLNKGGLTSLFDLWNIIKTESKTKLEEKIQIIKLFQSMCFLANSSSIFIEQADQFTDIIITPHKKNRSLEEFASEDEVNEVDEVASEGGDE